MPKSMVPTITERPVRPDFHVKEMLLNVSFIPDDDAPLEEGVRRVYRIAARTPEGIVRVRREPENRGRTHDNLLLYKLQWDSEYTRLISDCADELPALEPACRIIVAIPVAAPDERSSIRRCLQAFSKQSLPADQSEIVLFLNRPHDVSSEQLGKASQTRQAVEQFLSDYPGLRVRFFERALDRSVLTIGYVRKILQDVLVERTLRRAREFGDPLVLRTDADTCAVHRDLLANYLKQASRRPAVDAFAGELDWDWRECVENALLLYSCRLEVLLGRFMGAWGVPVGGGGANFAIRLSRYADAGGYDPASWLGEDVALGRGVRLARQNDPQTFSPIAFAGARSVLMTSARRAAASIKAGHASILQWSIEETKFGESNSEIRDRAQFTTAPFMHQLNDPRFPELAEKITNETLDFLFSTRRALRQKACAAVLRRYFGIDCRLEKNRVAFGDVSKLKRWLVEFRSTAPAVWQARYGEPL